MIARWRKRIEARLSASRVAQRVLTLASGTAMAQVIGVGAMPIVTRLYTPAQMGILSLFLSFFAFWASSLSLRYEYAILIAKNDEESHFVHRLGCLLVIGMSVASLPALYWLRKVNLLGFGLLPEWTPFASVPILTGYGLFMVHRAWALRAGLMKDITKASIVRAGAGSLAQIAFGAFYAGVSGLFAAQLIASWAAMLKLSSVVSKHYQLSKNKNSSFSGIRAAAQRYAKFPLMEAPSAWIDQLGMLLPIPMIASMHGPAAAGWFSLARVIVGIPNSQIGSAVADVFQMELAYAVSIKDTTRARRLFYGFARNLALAGLLPFALISALGIWLVPWVFGSEWREAGVAAVLIAPWLYVSLIVSPLSRMLSVLRAQELKLFYDITAIMLLVSSFFIAKSGGYSFAQTVLIISVAQIIGYIVYSAVLITAIESRLASAGKS